MGGKKPQDEDVDWQEGDEYYDSDEHQQQTQKPRYAKKRVLQRWGPDEDQFLLLAIVATARAKNIELPWFEIGQQCVPTASPAAITQHLNKVRDARMEHSRRCPATKKNKSTAAKSAATVRQGRGQGLLPPPSKPRGVQQKRSHTDAEESIEPRRKKINRSRQHSTVEHAQPTTKRPRRIEEISGYSLGSTEQERFLCDEVSSVNAITMSNMPLVQDFMGNQYPFDFDDNAFMGSNHEVHQAIINQTAARCRQADVYPGDEQIMEASKNYGLSGGLETTFQLPQPRYPVPRFRGEAPKIDYSAFTKQGASPEEAIIVESPQAKHQSEVKAESTSQFDIEQMQPLQSLLQQQVSIESSSQAAIAQMQSNVDNNTTGSCYHTPFSSAPHSITAADPRSVGWSNTQGSIQDFMQSMSSYKTAPQTAFDWSPSKEAQYTAAADTYAFSARGMNALGYDTMPTMQPFEPLNNAAIYTGTSYLNPTPPDSLNTSQLISPVHTSIDPIADAVPAISSVNSSILDSNLEPLLDAHLFNDDFNFFDTRAAVEDGVIKLENTEQYIYGQEGMNQFSCFGSGEGAIF